MLKLALKITFLLGLVLSSIGLLRVSYFQLKANAAQYLMQSAWREMIAENDNSVSQIKIKPWPWADTWPVFELVIPQIGLTSLVLKDSSGESLAFGPGLLSTQIMPGNRGNSFVAAHRDTHFRNIEQLKKGHLMSITKQDGKRLTFLIDQVRIVDSRLEGPVLFTEQKRLTLISCYPFDAKIPNTPYRYLVSGQLQDSITKPIAGVY